MITQFWFEHSAICSQVLDDILFGRVVPAKVSRISLKLNSETLLSHALNDILIAQPCPAAVSRFSFK